MHTTSSLFSSSSRWSTHTSLSLHLTVQENLSRYLSRCKTPQRNTNQGQRCALAVTTDPNRVYIRTYTAPCSGPCLPVFTIFLSSSTHTYIITTPQSLSLPHSLPQRRRARVTRSCSYTAPVASYSLQSRACAAKASRSLRLRCE
jgi:hypothetical protein